MTAELLDGKSLASQLERELAADVAQFVAAGHRPPGLDVVLVGDDPASQVYVRNKHAACGRVGIAGNLHRLPSTTTEAALLAQIEQLNADPRVDGILVQLPLPAGLDATQILDRIDPRKDVDAFHPENVGLLVQGRPRFQPCTPHGILRLLAHYGVETAGRHAVVLGRSEIVGKPMANLLLQKGRGADATVTVCHSRTPDVAQFTRQADLLIAAVGRPRFVTAEMVRPGATVIDVGIHRVDGRLVGDVDFEGVRQVAGRISPVPGGVGPLTIAMLLHNALQAARLRAGTIGG